jgi:hypothetical protein
MMIKALKMTAESTALCGLCRPHDIEACQRRIRCHEHRGNDREVFRDIIGDGESRLGLAGYEELLPDRHDPISLVGFESRSTMLPASFAAIVPVFSATAKF